MKFDMKDLNPGAKFYFDAADPEAGSITLRALNVAAHEKIQAQCVARMTEYNEDGVRNEVVVTDEAKQSELTWDYAILDWQGLEDENGAPIPCTYENKAALMRESLVFSGMVHRFLKKLNRDMKKRVEAERKN